MQTTGPMCHRGDTQNAANFDKSINILIHLLNFSFFSDDIRGAVYCTGTTYSQWLGNWDHDFESQLNRV